MDSNRTQQHLWNLTLHIGDSCFSLLLSMTENFPMHSMCKIENLTLEDYLVYFFHSSSGDDHIRFFSALH